MFEYVLAKKVALIPGLVRTVRHLFKLQQKSLRRTGLQTEKQLSRASRTQKRTPLLQMHHFGTCLVGRVRSVTRVLLCHAQRWTH